MMRGPFRSMALGGLAFGVLLIVVGTLFFLVNQKIINIVFDFWTVCSIGLVLLGVVVIGGTLWARRMMRGGWRRWAEGWERDWERPQQPP